MLNENFFRVRIRAFTSLKDYKYSSALAWLRSFKPLSVISIKKEEEQIIAFLALYYNFQDDYINIRQNLNEKIIGKIYKENMQKEVMMICTNTQSIFKYKDMYKSLKDNKST